MKSNNRVFSILPSGAGARIFDDKVPLREHISELLPSFMKKLAQARENIL